MKHNIYFGNLLKKEKIESIFANDYTNTKFIQHLFLLYNNFNTPDSIYIPNLKKNKFLIKKIIHKSFSFPYIIKRPSIDLGEGVFLIHDEIELEEILAKTEGETLCIQEYIQKNGSISIIEINNTPQFGGFEETTGIKFGEHLIEYLAKRDD